MKESLDQTSKRLDSMIKERQRDRDAMRGSVSLFARDVRKQAERVMTQSVANLTDARRNVPMPPLSTPLPPRLEAVSSIPVNAQKRILELQEELRAAKAETEKQVSSGFS